MQSRGAGMLCGECGEVPDVPEGVYDRTLHLPYMLVVPVPRFGVDRLADASQHAQAAQVVALHMVGTEAAEKADGSRGRVELGQLVLLDGLPVARRSGVDWRGFENGGGHAVS
jgi:hypothetical protein